MNRPHRRRFAITFAILAATLLGSVVAFADEVLEEVSAFDIPDQPLDQALLEFSKQADVQIIMAAETTRDFEAVGIHGSQRNRDALERLLADRGLQYTEHSNRTIAVHQVVAADAGGDSDPGNGRTAGATPRPVMMAQAVEQSQKSQRAETESDEDERKQPLEEIIVTGTHIRGIAPESSPVRVFTREDIEISGAATAQDFIQTLPQNFGGGSNSDIRGLPDNRDAGFNVGHGSSVNMRGLGSGSTLVLLNGHRMAPTSRIGDFVDISLIPATAIERIEVLTDGASSIYGADAVGGVVNFILRSDYDGIESSYRYGMVTEGDFDEHRASITGGKNWGSGNALVTYEFFSQTDLSAADRSFSQDAIMPNVLMPSQRRHSVLTSASQELTPDLKLFGDFSFSRREASLDQISLAGEFAHIESPTRSVHVSSGGSWKASNTWFIDFAGTYSNVTLNKVEVGDTNVDTTTETVIWASDAKASGSLFSLPGGEVKLAIGGHYRSEEYTNLNNLSDGVSGASKRHVYAAFSEAFIPIVGSHNAVPGIDRLEMNVSGRYADFSDFGSTANPKIGVLWSPFDTLQFRSSYSTSFKPPVLGFVNSLDGFGLAYPTAAFNAIFGLTPGDPSIADVVGLAVFGTADNLEAEKSRAFTGGFDFTQEWGEHALTITSTYFDIKFENRLGPTPCPVCTSNFDVPNIAFNSPELFPDGTVIFDPTLDQVTQVLDSLDFPATQFGGADPFDAAFIDFHRVTRNLSLTFVRGYDFDIGYTYDTDDGIFSMGLDGTFLRDFQQQGSVATPLVELLNTQFNPVDLKLRGRGGYSHNGFSANFFLNYTDSYRVDNTPDATSIDSWTTIDLSFSYDTQGSFDDSLFNNLVFRLSVLNLFDEDPPATPSVPMLRIFGYDPTNASPLNRFVAFEVTKRF